MGKHYKIVPLPQKQFLINLPKNPNFMSDDLITVFNTKPKAHILHE